ncbi:MAG: hypothetical protein P4L35_05975 [Ignavibacteriaceae bacterium]|nr:hypothetical protein [Ignavibacteriaceae bacterium]
MNKIFVILFLFTITIFPQAAKNILTLKNELKQNMISGNSDPLPVKEEFSKKSVLLAITYSIILPGMGELYAGNYTIGKYFTIAEGIFWGTYIGMNQYSNWQKERYHSFAASNGGVNLAGKSDDYFTNIGIYSDINEYNDDMARNGEFSKMYNSPQDYWKWTGGDRVAYRTMWTAGEQAHNNLRFVIGALVLNRVASAINAARLAAAYNKNASENMGWNISAGMSSVASLPPGVILNFQYGL